VTGIASKTMMKEVASELDGHCHLKFPTSAMSASRIYPNSNHICSIYIAFIRVSSSRQVL